jgi:hypothetical protein
LSDRSAFLLVGCAILLLWDGSAVEEGGAWIGKT